MGAKLEQQFNAEIELIAGAGGVLAVAVDGAEIFSKKKSGHFPTAEEICDLISQS